MRILMHYKLVVEWVKTVEEMMVEMVGNYIYHHNFGLMDTNTLLAKTL
jgi:hypothetical protein